MNATHYSALRSYAAQKGAVVGGMWIASFACFIGGLSHPGLSFISMLAGVGSIFATGILVRGFRRQTGEIGFGMAYWMSLQMFFYASILMAAAQFIYFRYMDNGFLADTYASLMQQPEAAKILQEMGYGANYQELVEQAIAIWRTVSPIELTFDFLVSNFFLGFLLSLPAAIIGRAGRAPETNRPKQ